jgi:hypothetical protein
MLFDGYRWELEAKRRSGRLSSALEKAQMTLYMLSNKSIRPDFFGFAETKN